MPPAIRIENLGKRYRVNHAVQHASYRTLRDALVSAAAAPLRRLRAGGHNGSIEDFWALKDINLDVEPGEVVGIIGRNGAGKSTLLKILSRITKPTTGRVTLRGRVGSLLEVGTGFHPELTGRENVYLNGGILGMSRKEIDRNFDAIVDFSGVEKFLDTPVKRYSSGMQVRLAFAVAAHLDPEILIVDEVLAVGDAEFQRKCLGKMSAVGGEGRTVLFVSHDLANVGRLCHRAILLDRGIVVRDGEASSVIAHYANDGSVKMDGCADLRLRHDRSGSGAGRFDSIELLVSGERQAVCPIRADLVVRLKIHIDRPLEFAPISILIATGEGIPVHEFFNDSLACMSIPGKHRVCVTIPRVGLYPGRYVINLWMGTREHDRVDYLKDAISFDVVQTPQSEHRRSLRRSNGLVLQHADWTCESTVDLPIDGIAEG